MELNLDLSKEELVEVAKMAFIAQYVMDSSGIYSTGYRYPNWETFQKALRQLNRTLSQHIQEDGLLEVDGNNRKIFTHTIKMEDELAPVLDQFSREIFLQQICKAITDRDCMEEYGVTPNMQVIGDNSVYDILYQNNWKELKENGLKNIKLQH